MKGPTRTPPEVDLDSGLREGSRDSRYSPRPPRVDYTRDFRKLLQRCMKVDASDLHLKVGSPPYYRVDGALEVFDKVAAVTVEDMDSIIHYVLSSSQRKYLSKRGEIDMAHLEKGIGRFRVNVFRQRGSVSIVLRRIKSRIPDFEQLHLPSAVEQFAKMQRGLVLVTGTTGSGKSTSLAAIIDYINRHRKCHIVTIEDPIEYMHEDQMGVVNQREVTIDTEDFGSALKSVMRQDPDVILVGEMRDLETFQAAVSAAETGHLVFSTLHTTNVMQTIDRIVDLFPSNQQEQIRSQLSQNLQAMMCMRLVARSDGSGRVPACEVLIATPAVKRLIKENRIAQLPLAIQQGREDGMQTFNDSLYDLVKEGLIAEEDAYTWSDNPEELKMLLKGIRLSSTRGGILDRGTGSTEGGSM
jgi:twitching motility protein PilT